MPLIIVPTPIGNLEDITLRALKVLRKADVIACEDTRRTLNLLNHYKVKKPLLSYHEHNERKRTEELVARLEEGVLVALVSDAGTPAVSDPGTILLKACIERGIPFDVLPGPTAFVPALVLSGFCIEKFSFFGFLPKKGQKRRRALELLKEAPGALVLYASVHRIERDLDDLATVLGEREAMVARELTKLHQETLRGSLSDLSNEVSRRPRKGEFVIVIAPAPEGPVAKGDDEWVEAAGDLRERGLPVLEVVKVVNERYGIPKNTIKKWLLGPGGPEEGERNG